MRVIHSDEIIDIGPYHPAIFLAGPTPRSQDVVSWRIEAIQLLESMKFEEAVFVPERKNWESNFEYLEQVEWEDVGLNHRAGVIVFWIPRNLETLPGFTTNIEFGRFVVSENKHRVVYGRPDDAPKNNYLDWLYYKNIGEKPHNNLESTLKEAIRLLDN